jgi:phosphatidylglycerol:prolipoprotein diacylglycerol transferase
MLPYIVFDLFGNHLKINSYTLFTFIAAFVGLAIGMVQLGRGGISRHRALFMLAMMCVAFFVGARLWNFAVNPDFYLSGKMAVWELRLGGFSLYGGITGAFFVFMTCTFLMRIDTWRALDILVIPWAIAFTLARVGCFMAGCCAGKLTLSQFGVQFPSAVVLGKTLKGMSGIFQTTRPALYPTQLFELGLALFGLIPALFIGSRLKTTTGITFLVYGIWFSAMRLVILYFRELPYEPFIVNIVYPCIYLMLIIVGAVLLILRIKRQNPIN